MACECEMSVALSQSAYTPGSTVSATITLRATAAPGAGSSAAAEAAIAAVKALEIASKTGGSNGRTDGSALHRLPSSSEVMDSHRAVVDYVVCEVFGRWSSDWARVKPDAHPKSAPRRPRSPSATPTTLSSSTSAELTSTNALSARRVEHDQEPWEAALDDAAQVGARAGTAVEHYSEFIFRSQPHVVCRNLHVIGGTTARFQVDCVLPEPLPPTLRGIAMKYSYKMSIVAVVRGASGGPKTLRVPIRIVTAGMDSHRVSSIIPVPTPEHAGPTLNVFLQNPETEVALSIESSSLTAAPPHDIDMALRLSMNGRLTPYRTDEELWKSQNNFSSDTGSLSPEDYFSNLMLGSPMPAEDMPHSPHPSRDSVRSSDGHPISPASSSSLLKNDVLPVYSISKGDKTLASIFLPKRVHHLGETLDAVFDFSDRQIACHRVSARLEVQEVVLPRHALSPNISGNLTSTSSTDNSVVIRTVYGEHSEFVMHSRNAYMTFLIPQDAPVSFSTEVVGVRWILNFVFLTPSSPEAVASSPGLGNGDLPAANQQTIEREQNGTESESANEPAANEVPENLCDVLNWSLPIVVTGRPASQWVGKTFHALRLQ